MKKLLLLLGILAAFAFVAVAQDASQAGGAQGTTTTSSTGKKKSGDHSGMAMDHQGSSKSGKSTTLTGCLSSSANSEGMYTLSNAKMKRGVEVGPPDKVKDHAGHQVSLTGKWATGAEAGEKEGAEKAGAKEEKGERHFEVDNVKHLSDTCSEAPGGGTTGTKEKGMKGKSKGTGEASSTPKGF